MLNIKPNAKVAPEILKPVVAELWRSPRLKGMDKGGKDEPASSLPVSANELSAEAKSLRSVETQAHEMSKSEVMDVENSEERIRASRAERGAAARDLRRAFRRRARRRAVLEARRRHGGYFPGAGRTPGERGQGVRESRGSRAPRDTVGARAV